jgi:Caspase domain/PAN domain
VKLEFVLRQMEIDREGKTTIVMLDACRDNPLTRNLARSMGTRSAGIGRGLAAASTGLGTFIAYSTQPGNVALDGKGRNSPFTSALVKHMGAKGRNLPATMIEVRKEVVAATGGQQVPWDHSALTGDFFFAPGAAAPSLGSVASAPAGTSADVAALQERLRKLEEEAKRRDAATAPVPPRNTGAVPPVTPKPAIARDSPSFQIEENVRIDGLKYSDQREPSPAACRESCEQDTRCVAFQHGRRSPMMGQCHLFSRVDARHEDANWRSGVRTDAPQPTETALLPSLLNRLKVSIGVPLSRKEKGFDIYEGVAVMGPSIKMSATDSSAGCQAVCRNTAGCFAATYNDFFRGKNVACLVYRDVTDVMRAPTATLMIRSD